MARIRNYHIYIGTFITIFLHFSFSHGVNFKWFYDFWNQHELIMNCQSIK
jgi:hypothetical protein